jgi:hypothetical protein
MDRDRQLRYNSFRIHDHEDDLMWWVLIVNKRREIREIEKRVQEFFSPLNEDLSVEPIEGLVTETGLRYKLINFCANKEATKADFKRFYGGRVVKDTKLYHRESVDGLAKYLVNELEG